jgi:hypothetical protein
MIRIRRVDPDVMIVDVFVFLTQPPHSPATIVRDHQKNIHHVNAIDVFRIRNDASVVHRSGVKLITTFPTAPAIRRAKDSTATIGGFDRRVDHI